LAGLSHWPLHASETGRPCKRGDDVRNPLDARRCTVQLSTGQLYLDAVASPATSLLGHDLPVMPALDPLDAHRLLASLQAGYECITTTPSFSAAAEFAMQLALLTAGGNGRVVEANAFDGEPATGDDFIVAHENETLGRSGRWLASAAWQRAPHLVVIGEAIALGRPFGAVFARHDHSEKFRSVNPGAAQPAGTEALARVAATIETVESEGLLLHGLELGDYLERRIDAVRSVCAEIESVKRIGLSFRFTFAPPLSSSRVRRRMCERGVLAGVDESGRLAIDPPLVLRIAEADVITGALRGAILDLPMVSAAACCAACENNP
jgi:acetylornithine/succinyldiaminopimelate/putrescine aminotransferase